MVWDTLCKMKPINAFLLPLQQKIYRIDLLQTIVKSKIIKSSRLPSELTKTHMFTRTKCKATQTTSPGELHVI